MDSSNSGSISSSGEEEYNSHPHHQTPQLPAVSFLNHHPITHLGSISNPQSSFVYSHHPSMFDLSSTYLHHTLSQSQPNSNSGPHNSLLNLDTGSGTFQGQRSTDPSTLPSSSAAATAGTKNQCLSGSHHALSHDKNIINATQLSPAPTKSNIPKKRTRASRRAPTTILTTDTTNFRSMVQEFTGIPPPPFSSPSSYSRRLNLTASSQKVVPPIQSSLFLSSPSTSSRLLHNYNMTNISSSATTTNNSSFINCNNNYQLPHDLGLSFHQPHNNIMLSMQNHPILAFHPSPPPLHNLENPLDAGFGEKSEASLSMPSLEDLNNAHLVATTARLVSGHEHATSEGMPLITSSRADGSTVLGGGRRDPFRSLDGNYGTVASAGSCKLNISGSASSSLNPDKALESNEGTVDSWICSSD